MEHKKNKNNYASFIPSCWASCCYKMLGVKQVFCSQACQLQDGLLQRIPLNSEVCEFAAEYIVLYQHVFAGINPLIYYYVDS